MARTADKQGAHVDPADPNTPKPDRSTWNAHQTRAFASAAMTAYRDGLRLAGKPDIRSALIDDLSAYHKISEEQCIDRCINWEKWSVEEWERQPRDTKEGLKDFYAKVQSWSFDLLWFAYLQAEGYEYPISAVIADSIPGAKSAQPRHLDFGSGVGVTSQMFLRLGYQSTLADVSDTLLAFARFRLERRGDQAQYINLKESGLPIGSYDVITAVDTLTHIPPADFAASVEMLHRALKPGGHLIANFDVRPASPENAWHLYSDDRLLRFKLHRIGFEPVERLDRGFTLYQRVEPDSLQHAVRGVRDLVFLRSPLRPLYRQLRWRLHDLKAHGPAAH
jgi:SAM-dependent methyltransferase